VNGFDTRILNKQYTNSKQFPAPVE